MLPASSEVKTNRGFEGSRLRKVDHALSESALNRVIGCNLVCQLDTSADCSKIEIAGRSGVLFMEPSVQGCFRMANMYTLWDNHAFWPNIQRSYLLRKVPDCKVSCAHKCVAASEVQHLRSRSFA